VNRSIINFEATVCSGGYDTDGDDVYVVRLMANHHVVATWSVGHDPGYLMTQDRAHLDAFVSIKLFELLHGEKVQHNG
jgi:hypothetical protein